MSSAATAEGVWKCWLDERGPPPPTLTQPHPIPAHAFDQLSSFLFFFFLNFGFISCGAAIEPRDLYMLGKHPPQFCHEQSDFLNFICGAGGGGVEPRALCMLGRLSSPALHPQPL